MRNALVYAVVVALLLGVVAESRAAIVDREILKSFFETGDKPTQAQSATLIDSTLTTEVTYGATIEEHGLTLDNGQIATDAQGKIRVFGEGETVNGTVDFGAIGDNAVFNPLGLPTSGTIPFAGIQFTLSDGLHFGFLQYRLDAPDAATPYAVHLDYFVYEDEAGVPITTFYQAVPEPAAWMTLGAGVCWMVGRRRRGGRGIPERAA